MSEFVKVSRDGAVLVVTLARPEKKNALTGAMYEALIAAFARASDDSEVGALLFEGSGGVFSAGNDIGDFLAYALAPGALIGETPHKQVGTYHAHPEKGPIKLQNHHCADRYRFIWIRELHLPGPEDIGTGPAIGEEAK